MSTRTLIVDDEPLIRWSLRETLQADGFLVSEAGDGAEARAALAGESFDLVFLDHHLPDTTGLELLTELHAAGDQPVVIMMTAYGTIENAVRAMKLGAYDFLTKPFEMDQMKLIVERALETTRLRREVRALREQLQQRGETGQLIGTDASLEPVLDAIRRVARTDQVTVLLRGETGTGKDLLARTIHEMSPRADKPFVNITCTAISESLLESELFGHERGAFTDAKDRKDGLLELADGGTAFLDEVGDMPPSLQAKLLRFLEERRFRRVGGTRELEVDVRILAATNRNLEEAISAGTFRADLFYRLAVITIDVPPLRMRRADIRLLAQHFLEHFAREFAKPLPRLGPDAVASLEAYAWPGNVRELRNVIERALLLSDATELTAADIRTSPGGNGGSRAIPATLGTLPPDGFDLAQLDDLEVGLLRQALERTGGNQVQAAALLGITRDRLRYRLKKHGLSG